MGYPVAYSPARDERTDRVVRLLKRVLGILGLLAPLARPAKPALKNMASIPFTISGIGVFVAAVFLLNVVAGLMILGAALILLEHMVADE